MKKNGVSGQHVLATPPALFGKNSVKHSTAQWLAMGHRPAANIAFHTNGTNALYGVFSRWICETTLKDFSDSLEILVQRWGGTELSDLGERTRQTTNIKTLCTQLTARTETKSLICVKYFI